MFLSHLPLARPADTIDQMGEAGQVEWSDITFGCTCQICPTNKLYARSTS